MLSIDQLTIKLSKIFNELLPKDLKYVFKFQYEDDNSINFLIVTYDNFATLFKNKDKRGIINYLVPILNSSISLLNKKIQIDIEVCENYGK
ncbi:hypothetical protein [Spiroplasma turonicum]|uniref:Uncharacterized protein n=1 Tax=Spiroplasma turonicum TaxID=216946 RepID=A0A0K1P705_9MOLU|nr:hypothetical protein [Spiroplasma turonicum]AKU80060.1 hypothetical protein STURON_00814 [Spiroplasma turonicum]ALX71062.1 hypothetical protein STURO_v1c08110 [Spiroplasma turonicum]